MLRPAVWVALGSGNGCVQAECPNPPCTGTPQVPDPPPTPSGCDGTVSATEAVEYTPSNIAVTGVTVAGYQPDLIVFSVVGYVALRAGWS